MTWVDFHSHCLPEIDDGAKTVQESHNMLKLALEQSVDTVVATPHYKLTNELPSDFAKRRDAALEKVQASLEKGAYPRIILGCEIMLSQHLEEKDLSPLIIREFNAMLFEFPITGFRPWIINEIENITFKYKITPIIAHFERYGSIPAQHFEALAGIDGVVFQFNNTALRSFSAIRKMNRLLDMGVTVILSSDAHNDGSRCYDFDIPNKILEKRSIFSLPARKLIERIKNTPAPFFN